MVELCSMWQKMAIDDIKAPSKYSVNGGPFGSKLVTKDYKPDGIPVIRGSNLPADERFSFDDFVFVSPEKADELFSNNAYPGDIVVTQRGTLGQVGIIPKDSPFNRFVISQSQMKLTVDNSKADPLFIYYYFRMPKTVQHIHNLASSSGVPHINLDVFRKFEICIPPLTIQRKIAAVLSAYDDLIENNTRRIEILEEMAQTIYHEWFVNFRFPGHENVKMVDSPLGPIPEGWGVKELADAADVIDCLHSKKPVQVEDKSDRYGLLLQVWNIGENGKLDLSKKFCVSESDYKLWIRRIEVHEGDCVITNVGRIGAIAQVPVGVKAAIGRNMTAVRPKDGIITPTFLLEYLLSPASEHEKLLKRDSGTIMDSLNVKGIVKLRMVVPPFTLVQEYETLTRPLRHELEILQQKNDILHQTRDLLLPKLMSGEIDVSELDISVVD